MPSREILNADNVIATGRIKSMSGAFAATNLTTEDGVVPMRPLINGRCESLSFKNEVKLGDVYDIKKHVGEGSVVNVGELGCVMGRLLVPKTAQWTTFRIWARLDIQPKPYTDMDVDRNDCIFNITSAVFNRELAKLMLVVPATAIHFSVPAGNDVGAVNFCNVRVYNGANVNINRFFGVITITQELANQLESIFFSLVDTLFAMGIIEQKESFIYLCLAAAWSTVAGPQIGRAGSAIARLSNIGLNTHIGAIEMKILNVLNNKSVLWQVSRRIYTVQELWSWYKILFSYNIANGSAIPGILVGKAVSEIDVHALTTFVTNQNILLYGYVPVFIGDPIVQLKNLGTVLSKLQVANSVRRFTISEKDKLTIKERMTAYIFLSYMLHGSANVRHPLGAWGLSDAMEAAILTNAVVIGGVRLVPRASIWRDPELLHSDLVVSWDIGHIAADGTWVVIPITSMADDAVEKWVRENINRMH